MAQGLDTGMGTRDVGVGRLANPLGIDRCEEVIRQPLSTPSEPLVRPHTDPPSLNRYLNYEEGNLTKQIVFKDRERAPPLIFSSLRKGK